MHASLEFGWHLPQLGLQPLTNRLPQNRKSSAERLAADVRKAEERERLRLPLAPSLAVGGCVFTPRADGGPVCPTQHNDSG